MAAVYICKYACFVWSHVLKLSCFFIDGPSGHSLLLKYSTSDFGEYQRTWPITYHVVQLFNVLFNVPFSVQSESLNVI